MPATAALPNAAFMKSRRFIVSSSLRSHPHSTVTILQRFSNCTYWKKHAHYSETSETPNDRFSRYPRNAGSLSGTRQ
jgi:hypothetical protein